MPDRTIAESVRTGAVIVDQLIRAGVREAVVCPGSRSAPLALALAEADRMGRLRLHVRTDERTASFLALGLAKASRKVVPVVMTSGTAVANCLPAMVEASMSGVPLMVLSANRPLALVGTGANQTIDQAEIFGTHSRATINTEGLEEHALRDSINRAVTAALDVTAGGGVHVDVPLVEPLVPGMIDDLALLAQDIAEAPAATPTFPVPRPLPFPEVTVDLSKRTLVIAGSAADQAWARSIADELADIPTIAEPTAAAPDFPIHSAALGMFTTGMVAHGEYSALTRPEQIVLVGRTTLHRPVAQLLADEAIELIILSDVREHPAPRQHITQVGSRVRVEGDHPEGWLQVCQGISDLGVEATRKALELKDEDGDEEPIEQFSAVHAMAAVADQLSDGDQLVLGASSTIRDASLAGLPFDGVRTLANRGAAGIDGTVSTAIGAAMAYAAADPSAPRAPRTVAVMGDLTFLHDVTGLNIGPLETRPENLLIVVINDDGGGIFETLEPGHPYLRTFANAAPAFERVFGTPTGADVASLCAAFHVEHQLVDNATDLARAVEDHGEAGTAGITVVEARVNREWRRVIQDHIRTTVNP